MLLQNTIKDIQNLSIFSKIILVVLLLTAIISIGRGISNATSSELGTSASQDFQWSPTVLLSKGVNPYLYYLNIVGGDLSISTSAVPIYCTTCDDAEINQTQYPNYAHGLYVLLLPFSKLDWSQAQKAWVLLSIVLTLITLVLLAQKSQLDRIPLLFIFLIYLSSTSLRNSLGSGQHSILILFAFTCFFIGNSFSTLLSGIAYLKYSFAPPLVIYVLIKKGLKGFLLSITLPLIGFIIFYLIQSEKNLYSLFVQPLAVNSIAVGNGLSDYMTIASFITGIDSKLLQILNLYFLPTIASIVLTFILIRRANDALYEFSVLSLISLLFFKHLIYDYIFLLPVLLYNVRHIKSIYSKISIMLIMYFWFFIKFLLSFEFYNFFASSQISTVVNFTILLIILFMVFLTRTKIKNNLS